MPWFLVAVLLLVAAVAAGAWLSMRHDEINWRTDYHAAVTESAQSGRPVLLVFTASWCAPCQRMRRHAWPDDRVEQLVDQWFIPVKLDIGDGELNPAAERYAVRSVPTIVVTDRLGSVVAEGGMMDADELATFLATAAASVEP